MGNVQKLRNASQVGGGVRAVALQVNFHSTYVTELV